MTTTARQQNASAMYVDSAAAILQDNDFNVKINSLHKITKDLNELVVMLYNAVSELGLKLSHKQYWQLLQYLDTLLLWNKAYNLTAITEPKEAMIKHIIDCLSVIPSLDTQATSFTQDLLDIGAGAGLPSVVIAICHPNRICNAVDSNQKKIRFIKQVANELNITNIKPIATRIESFTGDFELITSRAFASLNDFVCVASPYLKAQGKLVAMKGKSPTNDELEHLEKVWKIKIIELNVPYLTDDRHLVILERKL